MDRSDTHYNDVHGPAEGEEESKLDDLTYTGGAIQAFHRIVLSRDLATGEAATSA